MGVRSSELETRWGEEGGSMDPCKRFHATVDQRPNAFLGSGLGRAQIIWIS